MAGVGGEKIIGKVNLLEAIGSQDFHFVHHFDRVTIADFGTNHFTADTEDAFKGAAAAGNHADGKIQGPVATQRQQVAGRQGQPVNVDPGWFGAGVRDLSTIPKGKSLDNVPVCLLFNGADQVYDRLFPLAQYNGIQFGILLQGGFSPEGYMGPAHDRLHGGIDGLGVTYNGHGRVKCHGDGCKAQHRRLEGMDLFGQDVATVGEYDIVANFYFKAGRFKYRGNKGQAQRRGWSFINGIKRVYEQNTHTLSDSK